MRNDTCRDIPGGEISADRSHSILHIVTKWSCGILALATLSGCGYSLAGRGSFLPAYVKTIGVPAFANRTPVFNVETLLTEKVRRELIGRGKYTVLPEAANVDATLIGEVSSISVTPASFAPNALASRYVIAMSALIELRDNHTNTTIWEN